MLRNDALVTLTLLIYKKAENIFSTMFSAFNREIEYSYNLFIDFMYITSPMIPIIIIVANIIPPIAPINSKAKGKIRVKTAFIMRNVPTAFANLFLSPLKVFSL